MTIAPPDPATLAAGVRVAADGDVQTFETDEGIREVEARICRYDVGPDTYNTTWAPGWAEESLRAACTGDERGVTTGQRIPVVFGHDEKNIANVVGSVIGYRDDPVNGLVPRVRMANFDEVPSARIAYSLLRDGHISGWSFKYRDGVLRPDPKHRGALQFTKAKLVHISPVIDPSIPGTATVGVRSETSEEDEMDLTALSDSITAAVRDGIAEGLRAAGVAPTPDEPATPETLALAQATALAALGAVFTERSADDSAFGLLNAAVTANDELLASLGVDDEQVRAAKVVEPMVGEPAGMMDEPDDDEDEQVRAAGKEYADPGYQSDGQKRYPIDTAEHVRAALAFIGQEKNAAKYNAEDLAKVKAKIAVAAKKFGVDVSGGRSADDTPDPVASAQATLAKHGIR